MTILLGLGHLARLTTVRIFVGLVVGLGLSCLFQYQVEILFESPLKQHHPHVNHTLEVNDELEFGSWDQWATSKGCDHRHSCRYMSVLALNNSVGHLPGFLVPGVQKGGTTYLRNALMQHPNLQIARGFEGKAVEGGGEAHFFDLGLGWRKAGTRANRARLYSDRHFAESLEDYQTAPPRQMFDVTPSYTTKEETIAKIKELVPWVRIVMVLRDPTERYRSELEMFLSNDTKYACSQVPVNPEGYAAPGNMTEWLREYPNRRKAGNYYEPVARGLYADQVRMWLRYFKRDQIHVVQSEEMFADPNGQVASVFDFVGAPPYQLDLAKAAKNKRPRRQRSNINATRDACLGKHFTRRDREALTIYYRDQNRDLSTLLGIRFSWVKNR